MLCWNYEDTPKEMYTTTKECLKEAGGVCSLADARLDHGMWYT